MGGAVGKGGTGRMVRRLPPEVNLIDISANIS